MSATRLLHVSLGECLVTNLVPDSHAFPNKTRRVHDDAYTVPLVTGLSLPRHRLVTSVTVVPGDTLSASIERSSVKTTVTVTGRITVTLLLNQATKAQTSTRRTYLQPMTILY